ncbi:MAG: LPXTG cell wall anchor domain-containing protein [Oscillospiraceae bacterium]|nr:LPXTG cell wall anchor domain-containing protein [Oscillospiraceae bacterium]
MKQTILPEAHNDFIFAFVGNKSELILIGAVLLIAAALLWIFRRKK